MFRLLSLPFIVLSVVGAYYLEFIDPKFFSLPQWAISFRKPVPLLPYVSTDGYTCQVQPTQAHFLSYDPVLIYIENFLSPYETRYLTSLALPHYRNSTVLNSEKDGLGEILDKEVRRSETAWFMSPDPVVDCVRQRAAEFQGFSPNASMEALAAVKYHAGQEYKAHFDWDSFVEKKVDRKTSFFAILEANCTGGATHFPEVRGIAWNSGQPWCRFLDCGRKEEEGLFVRPVVGNALFWVNFQKNGTGHPATIHAGMPVIEGTKTGLNIWTYAKV